MAGPEHNYGVKTRAAESIWIDAVVQPKEELGMPIRRGGGVRVAEGWVREFERQNSLDRRWTSCCA